MKMYQHRFALRADLFFTGTWSANKLQELEHAWTTAKSILGGKELVVDVSGVAYPGKVGIGPPGSRAGFGARLTAPLPPGTEEFLRSFRLPAAAQAVGRPSGMQFFPHVLNKLIASVPGVPGLNWPEPVFHGVPSGLSREDVFEDLDVHREKRHDRHNQHPKRTTGEVIPTVNDYHDWSDTAGFRLRECAGSPQATGSERGRLRFHARRESRHRGRAPPRDSDRRQP